MSSKRVLVIDGESTSEMVKSELEDQGHEVDQASEFSEEAYLDRYDAVITEVGNGYLRGFNEIPDSTVIYTTNDEETVEQMLDGEVTSRTGFTSIDHPGDQEIFYAGKKETSLEDLDYLVDRI